ncbi:alpha/beta fold hydrolase [Parvicella tangerina]|uniref:3-oxoadipate enol-lactonase 2 n=1 Tax=Parvicella tangerina TaxID=2829795 RepID=A0A916JQY3_9FLAO|nr:alpha/beta hydrolase [Parvicella tangerina]CAG5086929.1 3-oxoadipate enol-lactonase 2 [Parvicella tangerina]
MKESNKSTNNTLKFDHKMVDKNHEKTILLLHGFLGSQLIWEAIIPELSASFNVITMDLPGHGASSVKGEVHTMEAMAKVVIDQLNNLGVSQVHLVGHSMGGYVGLEILKQQPELLDSLTLLNSTAKSDSLQKRQDRLRAVKVFDLSPKVYIREALNNLFYPPNLDRCQSEVERLQEIALLTSPAGAQACLRGMRIRADHVELINTTTVPVQYIAGMQDTTVTYDSIREQIKSSTIKLVAFEQSGHMSFAEEKEKCTNAIINFVSTL